jgi:energy-coupling factor transport system permease protein
MAFQYVPLDTPIHRLHALTKLSIVLTVSLLASFILDPKYKIPLIILVFIYAQLARIPWRGTIKLVVFVAISLTIANAIASLFIVQPDLFKVYPKEWASVVLLPITPAGFPVFGKTAITLGGLLWLTTAPLSAIAVITLVIAHIRATSLNETVQALTTIHAPFPVVYITMVALRFAPELTAQFTLIQQAQSLRGWQVNTRNPIKVARLYAPLLVPIVKHVIKSIDTMAMATQNRAFGFGPVTNMTSGNMSSLDKAIIIATWLLFFFMLFLIYTRNFGNL